MLGSGDACFNPSSRETEAGDVCEVEASLIYAVSYRRARGAIKNTASKNRQTNERK